MALGRIAKSPKFMRFSSPFISLSLSSALLVLAAIWSPYGWFFAGLGAFLTAFSVYSWRILDKLSGLRKAVAPENYQKIQAIPALAVLFSAMGGELFSEAISLIARPVTNEVIFDFIVLALSSVMLLLTGVGLLVWSEQRLFRPGFQDARRKYWRLNGSFIIITIFLGFGGEWLLLSSLVVISVIWLVKAGKKLSRRQLSRTYEAGEYRLWSFLMKLDGTFHSCLLFQVFLVSVLSIGISTPYFDWEVGDQLAFMGVLLGSLLCVFLAVEYGEKVKVVLWFGVGAGMSLFLASLALTWIDTRANPLLHSLGALTRQMAEPAGLPISTQIFTPVFVLALAGLLFGGALIHSSSNLYPGDKYAIKKMHRNEVRLYAGAILMLGFLNIGFRAVLNASPPELLDSKFFLIILSGSALATVSAFGLYGALAQKSPIDRFVIACSVSPAFDGQSKELHVLAWASARRQQAIRVGALAAVSVLVFSSILFSLQGRNTSDQLFREYTENLSVDPGETFGGSYPTPLQARTWVGISMQLITNDTVTAWLVDERGNRLPGSVSVSPLLPSASRRWSLDIPGAYVATFGLTDSDFDGQIVVRIRFERDPHEPYSLGPELIGMAFSLVFATSFSIQELRRILNIR